MTPSTVSRPGGRSHHGRLVALLAVPLLVVPLLTAAVSPTPDDGTTAGTGPVDVPAGLDAGAEVVETEVTLITGDTVIWRDAGDGDFTYETIPAPREDGREVIFTGSGDRENFYLYPDDTQGHLASGALDEELFNIPSLIRQGLDDESTGGVLPVIVTFDQDRSPRQLARATDALPATADPVAVERVNGAGVKVDRGTANRFRAAVLGPPPGNQTGRAATTNTDSDGLQGAVDRVLLDQQLEITLDESVPQIGAPQVWDAGYTGEGITVAVLDTGVDDSHPDLAGQVVAAEDFTGEDNTGDVHGHGTHVASTIAGTGAASDAARKGVAPDAELISGRVCNAEGTCPSSAIMAGMEWAAANADIVNMSLGGGPTDGTDILSQLLNELTAETGTLFVVAAGNTGCGPFRVGAPGSADAALTVAAVTKDDTRAWFSSCGPRLGDYAFKPDLTAPGWGSWLPAPPVPAWAPRWMRTTPQLTGRQWPPHTSQVRPRYWSKPTQT